LARGFRQTEWPQKPTEAHRGPQRLWDLRGLRWDACWPLNVWNGGGWGCRPGKGKLKPNPHRTAPHRTAPHRTAPLGTAPHRTARHRTAPHRTAPHGTARHRTAPHGTTPHMGRVSRRLCLQPTSHWPTATAPLSPAEIRFRRKWLRLSEMLCCTPQQKTQIVLPQALCPPGPPVGCLLDRGLFGGGGRQSLKP
jgi:hypothetical protein